MTVEASSEVTPMPYPYRNNNICTVIEMKFQLAFLGAEGYEFSGYTF